MGALSLVANLTLVPLVLCAPAPAQFETDTLATAQGDLKITFGDKRVYVAGDTENIPEMAELEQIDVAFLPMNLPYTMTPEMVVQAVRTFKPRIVYPYHFGNTDTSQLVRLLKDMEHVEVRIRKLR